MFVDNNTASAFGSQVAFSAITVAFIQRLKVWFPKLQEAPDVVHQIISGGLALGAAIGIHMAWSQGALPGQYMMQVSGVTLVGIGQGLWAVMKSITYNELIYRTTVKSQQSGKPAQVVGAGAVPKS